jgi:hypothetical protein
MSACLVLALTAPVLVVLFFATLARFRAAFGDADPPPAPRRPFLSARSTLSATRILPFGPSRVVVDGPATRSPPSLARRGVDGSPSRVVVAATGGIVVFRAVRVVDCGRAPSASTRVSGNVDLSKTNKETSPMYVFTV